MSVVPIDEQVLVSGIEDPQDEVLRLPRREFNLEPLRLLTELYYSVVLTTQ